MPEAPVGKGSAWTWLRYCVPALLALCTAAAPRAAHAQFRAGDRILEPVDASRWSVMRGHLRPVARAQFDRGELDPATRLGRVTMFFSRTVGQEADLLALLDQQQDRASANYHRWLSPEEFADRFGLTQGDLDKIVAWLQAQGLTVEQVSRSRTWVAFSGSARQVETALRTDLRRYAVRGETHFAASREPSLPSAFGSVVLGFRGLDDFRLKPRGRKLQSRLTSEISDRHFLAPGDLATIYNLAPLYSAGIDGTNQKIVVVGQTAINISDVRTFRSLSGLPANDPQLILVPGSADPGLVDIDIDEANLDLDWVGAVAPKATILYVYADPVNGNGVLDALTHAISQNLAPVVSMSYGLCESETDGFTQSDANMFASIAQQANSQGITIVAPTGDSGAADCDFSSNGVAELGLAVDLPGALPYVTSVGGTRFSGDASDPPTPSGYWGPATSNPSTALSYIPETSWNDTDASGLAATGGGSSIYFPKPSWQAGSGVPNDGARDVPDVSFNASANHDGYLVCSRDIPTNSPTCVVGFRDAPPSPPPGGSFTVFGGTSAGVPVFAGIVALLNQQANSPQGQGNINYILYPLATSFPAAFHDVTSGNNLVPCKTASPDCPTTGPNSGFLGFSAGPGYDLVTGLGSLDAYSLVTAWTSVSSTDASKGSSAPDFQLALSPPKLTISRGGSATATLTLTNINGFSGSIGVSCVAAQPLSCSVSNQSGNSRTITVSAASSGVAAPLRPNWPPMMLVLSLVAAAGLWAAASIKNGRIRWAPGLALACALIACKGGSDTNNSNNAPAGSVTVQGTSGGISHTANLSITLN